MKYLLILGMIVVYLIFAWFFSSIFPGHPIKQWWESKPDKD